MSKSRDAFRTISEVSDALDTPAHVLRFWESKFSQVKPVKRAGGRRYYRPADVDLLSGIKRLLHEDGMTIKGAQKLLREQGVKHIASMGADALAAPDPAPSAPAAIPVADVGITNVVAMPHPAKGPALSLNLSASNAEASPTAPENQDVAEDTKPDEPPMKDALDDRTLDMFADDPTEDAVIEDAAETTPPTEAASDVEDAVETSADEDAPAPEIAASTEAAEPAPTPTFTFPDDPSDNDSKAPARLFHLLQKTDPEALGAHAAQIAPLLARIEDVRSRIQTR
ncbi:MerR family transcriptional regulator [Pseudooctadecabacter jejudonensis]|uniref:MerR family regulatory protein n=1 Tax=Pseudooctadecabacter jejudonensis TaxID=1391910 RepID=A0A1Y5RKQ1_9RHOB|nr:MerR family transcriptional regulator [Pseudooctadecabacter jejudonensis]SLN18799.1 MerR family regulatory protein [Pseudooctadecabacter jejudonensis]